jgi:hypothetical protein
MQAIFFVIIGKNSETFLGLATAAFFFDLL